MSRNIGEKNGNSLTDAEVIAEAKKMTSAMKPFPVPNTISIIKGATSNALEQGQK